MPRTPEQVAADEALTAAIEAVHRAYFEPVQGVLTKYLVLAQRQWWDEADDAVTANYGTPRDNDVPLSDLLGMVEYASTRYRKVIAHDGEDL